MATITDLKQRGLRTTGATELKEHLRYDRAPNVPEAPVEKSDRNEALLALANSGNGARRCTRQMACSRVCPTRVYPSKHISDVIKDMEENSITPK